MAAAVVLFFLLLVPLPLKAQTGATLQGRVCDASGAILRSATVSVRDRLSGFDQHAVTDRDGRYRITAIPAGSYDVMATASGFRSELVAALTLEVGRTVVREFRLEVGNTSETV